MKRFVVSTVVVLAVSAPAVPASAQGQQFAGGALHSSELSNATIAFLATSDPDGDNARGTIVLENAFAGSSHVRARVTCLDVVGTNATVLGEITQSDVLAAPVGDEVLLLVSDFGNPVGGTTVDGQVSSAGGSVFFCQPPVPVPPSPEFTGNIVVRDA